MKVKDAIKRLQKMNPDATLVVRQYNGGEDVHRPVTEIKTRSAVQLAWPISEDYVNGKLPGVNYDDFKAKDVPESPGGFVDVTAL